MSSISEMADQLHSSIDLLLFSRRPSRLNRQPWRGSEPKVTSCHHALRLSKACSAIYSTLNWLVGCGRPMFGRC